ncbi:hypothetical protein D3C86_1419540 [compost metagenome]
MRNYTATGTTYKTEGVLKEPLIKRLSNGGQINYQSWIDLFFTKDIYILGLGLDYVESDLWWLITYRARNKFYKNRVSISNKISYFIPIEFEERSKAKLEVLRANDINVIVVDAQKGIVYYSSVLDRLEGLL